jgi:hypothetical protein
MATDDQTFMTSLLAQAFRRRPVESTRHTPAERWSRYVSPAEL